jgi:hypothetical protein
MVRGAPLWPDGVTAGGESKAPARFTDKAKSPLARRNPSLRNLDQACLRLGCNDGKVVSGDADVTRFRTGADSKPAISIMTAFGMKKPPGAAVGCTLIGTWVSK